MQGPAQVYVDRLPEAIGEFLRGATRFIRVAVCWFTHPDLYQTLLDRCHAGVQVELFINFDQLNFNPEGLDFEALAQAGATVYGFQGPGLLHHKCAVADGVRVLTGSGNWTRSTHADHILILENPALASDFSVIFDNLATQCTPLAQLKGLSPRQISLQQLYRPTGWSNYDIRRQIVSGARVWIALFKGKDKRLWERSVREQRYFLPGKPVLQDYWNEQQHWDAAAFRQWSDGRRLPRTAILYCSSLRIGDVVVVVTDSGTLLGIGIVGSEPELLEQGATARFVQWRRSLTVAAPTSLALPVKGLPLRRYRGSGLQLVDFLTQNAL